MSQRKPTPNILDDVLGAKPNEPVKLSVDEIRIDGGTQMRARLDPATVDEYAEVMSVTDWATFPPIIAYYDGDAYWLADGFHRVAAFRKAIAELGLPTQDHPIPADVRAGSRRDAILYAAGANAMHGLRRTNDDKQRAVDTLLRDAEWSRMSDRQIAKACNVSNTMVSDRRVKLVKEAAHLSTLTDRVTVMAHRNGTTYMMDVSGIGATSSETLPDWDAEFEDAGSLGSAPSAASGSRQRGATLARCTVCHRPLSDPASAVHGVGPCCASKRAVAAGDGSEDDDDTGAEDDVPVSFRDGYDSDEWYTPEEYIIAAVEVMGEIDLDPASSELAQTVVGARFYFTKNDDGLSKQWTGRVFLNPPYSNPGPWIDKVIREYYTNSRVTQAIVLVNNATETSWFQALLKRCPACILNRRISFWRHDHSNVGARQGQVIFYLGPKEHRAQFAQTFCLFGTIVEAIL